MIKLLVFLISLNLLACDFNVKKVNKGDQVPCNSWIVSEPQMQDIAKEKKELDIVKRENLTLKELGLVNEDIIKHHKTRADDIQKELNWEQTKSVWKSVGFFVLGVAATSVAAYAAIKSTK